jgi:hypothetical protein
MSLCLTDDGLSCITTTTRVEAGFLPAIAVASAIPSQVASLEACPEAPLIETATPSYSASRQYDNIMLFDHTGTPPSRASPS